jgi:hypothetical protein
MFSIKATGNSVRNVCIEQKFRCFRSFMFNYLENRKTCLERSVLGNQREVRPRCTNFARNTFLSDKYLGIYGRDTQDIIQWGLHHVILLSGCLNFGRGHWLHPQDGSQQRQHVPLKSPSPLTRLYGVLFTLYFVAIKTIWPREDVEGIRHGII